VHKRGEFGKFDMPAATTPAGIFICRATEHVLQQHEEKLHGDEYPVALTAAMQARAASLQCDQNLNFHQLAQCTTDVGEAGFMLIHY
jgi:hypothetical protein